MHKGSNVDIACIQEKLLSDNVIFLWHFNCLLNENFNSGGNLMIKC